MIVCIDGDDLPMAGQAGERQPKVPVPDGLLFSKHGGKLDVVRPDGSGLRWIPLDTGPGRSFAFQPGWSPNGKRIVVSMALRGAGCQEDIFTVRADGTDLRRVTNTPDSEEFGDWGPSRG
jgi:hypothetical protein